MARPGSAGWSTGASRGRLQLAAFLTSSAIRLSPAAVRLRQGEGDRPHLPLVEPRVGLEAKGRVAHLELRLRLEEADHLAVLGVGRHPVERPRHEARRGREDELVDARRDRPIVVGHLGDLGLHVGLALGALLLRAAFRRLLSLPDGLLHRGALFVAQDVSGRPGRTASLCGWLRVGHVRSSFHSTPRRNDAAECLELHPAPWHGANTMACEPMSSQVVFPPLAEKGARWMVSGPTRRTSRR